MPVRDLLSAASTQGASPADPYFYDVSLLLNGDGTNGAQNNTFLDSSTNNFTITRNGNTTQGSFSPYGSLWSNYFNGGSGLTTSSSASAFGTGDFTFECWLNFSSIPSSGNNYEIFVSGTSNGAEILYRGGYNQIEIAQSGVGTKLAYVWTPTVGTWYHFAVVRSSGTGYIFINGVQGSTGSLSGVNFVTGSTGIGFYNPSPQSYFNGYISNLRSVIGTAVYTSNFTPSTTPLAAITNTALLTCQSNRFVDNSSNNYTVSTYSSPSVQRFSPFNPTAPYSTSVIGGSGYFDGSSWLTTPSSSNVSFGSGDWTVDFWVYAASFSTSSPEQGTVWDNRYGGSTGISINVFSGGYVSPGQLSINTNSVAAAAAGGNLIAGAWNFVRVVRSSGTIYAYTNGTLAFTYSDGRTYGSPTIITNGSDWTGARTFTGYVSDLRQIAGTALSGSTIPTAPLTAVSGTQLLLSYTNAGIPDLAMQNNLQTVANAQVSTSVKKYGTGSLKFNGSTDWLSTASNQSAQFNAGNFTIECWMYPTSLSGANVFHCYGYQTTSTRSTLAYLNGGNLRFAYSPDGSTSTDSSLGAHGMSTGNWYYVAIVRNGATVTAYVNGTALSSPITISTTSVYNSAQPLVIGSDTTGDNFAGYIDDYRITKGYARYTTNFTPPTSALPTY